MDAGPTRLGGEVLCIGPVAIDLDVTGDAPLHPEELREWSGIGDVGVRAAGSIGYIAQTLKSLGRSVQLLSTVGDDFFAEEAIRQFASHGVDVSEVHHARGATSLAVYLRLFRGAKRPLIVRMPVYAPWPARPGPKILADPLAVVISGVLHFPEYARDTLPGLLRSYREKGIRTYLDPQFTTQLRREPWAGELAEVLGLANVLCCGDGEGEQLFGSSDVDEIISAAHGYGCETVIVKRGVKGTVVSDGSTRFEQPAAFVATLQHTTVGAGDAFLAGLVDATAAGEPLEPAIRWATATAAAWISLPYRDGIPTREQVELALDQVPQAR